MSDFKTAFALTSKWEGGYVNNPLDEGGETYRGISRKNWPNWEGWRIVDQFSPLLKQGQLIKSYQLEDLVEAFYIKHFWLSIKGDLITNQSIANLLFDWEVTSGVHAIKVIQKLVGTNPDGIVGLLTIGKINKCDAKPLFNQFKAARILFYEQIVERHPSQKVFLKGWLNRANAFTFQ